MSTNSGCIQDENSFQTTATYEWIGQGRQVLGVDRTVGEGEYDKFSVDWKVVVGGGGRRVLKTVDQTI